MSALRVIGVDPGPTPGVVVLDIADGLLVGSEVLQCTAGLLFPVVAALDADRRAWVAVERFVVRGRATAEQSQTRDQVGNLVALRPSTSAVRSAQQVKPWATDARLEAAGLLELCKGMRHARDAARHALFAAVHDGGIPDPLSKEWTR